MSDLSEKLGVATYRRSGGRAVIRVVGALDVAGAGRLIDETTQLDPGVGDRVVLYLRDVTFIDSAGIGALCYGEAFVKARGGAFAIAAPNPRTRAVLERAGLDGCCIPDDEARDTARRTQRDRTPEPSPPRWATLEADGGSVRNSTGSHGLIVTRTGTHDGVRLTPGGEIDVVPAPILSAQLHRAIGATVSSGWILATSRS